MAEFKMVRDRSGGIKWLFVQSGSKKIIARSWDEYKSTSDCMYDIEILKAQIRTAEIDEDVKPMNIKQKSVFSIFGGKEK